MDEVRRRQLARLRGEVIDPPIDSALEFVPDPELDAEYASDCASERNWDREPEPRGVWETKHKEVMQRYNTQPENEIEPEPFVVGYKRNSRGELVALPAPKWPNPGEPKTPEISRTHFKEELLRDDANRSLNDCVRWLAGRLRNPEFWNDVEQSFQGTHLSGPPSKLYDTQWSFLMGTWRARGIAPPTDDKLREWAMQYNEKHYTRKKANAKTEA